MQMPLKEIAELVGGQIIGDPDCFIEDARPLEFAENKHITFAEKGPSLKRIDQSGAAAVLVPNSVSKSSKPLVQVSNPRLAFAKVLGMFHPMRRPASGIHPSAVIGNGCQIDEMASVAAGAVLGDGVIIGRNAVIHPLVVLGDHVTIGDETVLYPHVTVLERCLIGQRTIIHSGTVIGSDGFGFVQDGGRHHKIPQTGIVRIDDDVEIGANNTIDRAGFGTTWIKSGVKTDDQIHIGHNVIIGEHTIIIAQVGIAGSTTIGHHVVLAGQAGIGGHLHIGNEVIVGPKTGVAQSVPDKQVISATPFAMPHRTWLRTQRELPKLPDLQKQVAQLEKRLKQLEKRQQTEKKSD